MRLGHPDKHPAPLMEAPRTGPWSRPLSRGCPRDLSQRTHDRCEVAERAVLSRADHSPLAQVATGAAALAGGPQQMCWWMAADRFERHVYDLRVRLRRAAVRQAQPRAVIVDRRTGQ